MLRSVTITAALLIVGLPAAGQTPTSVVRALVRQSLDQTSVENDLDVRIAAIRDLGRLGSEARVALPVLRAALKDEDIAVRSFAVDTMVRLDPVFLEEGVSALRECLHLSLKSTMRIQGIVPLNVLRYLGVGGRSAEAVVIEFVRESDLLLRVDALDALWAFGSDGESLVPILIGVLEDPIHQQHLPLLFEGVAFFVHPLITGQFPDDTSELYSLWTRGVFVMEMGRISRTRAANLLGRMGQRAAVAVPALRKALDEHSPQVRRAAREALEKIEKHP